MCKRSGGNHGNLNSSLFCCQSYGPWFLACLRFNGLWLEESCSC
jgi:hypothetical protein